MGVCPISSPPNESDQVHGWPKANAMATGPIRMVMRTSTQTIMQALWTPGQGGWVAVGIAEP